MGAGNELKEFLWPLSWKFSVEVVASRSLLQSALSRGIAKMFPRSHFLCNLIAFFFIQRWKSQFFLRVESLVRRGKENWTESYYGICIYLLNDVLMIVRKKICFLCANNDQKAILLSIVFMKTASGKSIKLVVFSLLCLANPCLGRWLRGDYRIDSRWTWKVSMKSLLEHVRSDKASSIRSSRWKPNCSTENY